MTYDGYTRKSSRDVRHSILVGRKLVAKDATDTHLGAIFSLGRGGRREDGEGGDKVGWAASGARAGERRPPLSGSGASAPEVVPLHSYPRRGLTGIIVIKSLNP